MSTISCCRSAATWPLVRSPCLGNCGNTTISAPALSSLLSSAESSLQASLNPTMNHLSIGAGEHPFLGSRISRHLLLGGMGYSKLGGWSTSHSSH
jgi:hypothetical protein